LRHSFDSTPSDITPMQLDELSQKLEDVSVVYAANFGIERDED
jgi:hypothetical protein